MNYNTKIIKSIRKSITLKLDKSWNLIVKAPFFMTNSSINNFIDKHKKWIEKHREKIKNNFFCDLLDEILFLWEKYKVNEKENLENWILFKNNNFYIDKNLSKEERKEKIISFYKKQAQDYIIKRTIYFIEKFNLEVNSIKIGSAKWRWWSCNSKKNIRFTYYLMFAPPKSIDYVIIHELAHLKEMNHSKHFRQEVERMMSDYKIHKRWFKENKWIKLF